MRITRVSYALALCTLSGFALLASQPTYADQGNKGLVEQCKERAKNPDAAPNCLGLCVGLAASCYEKDASFKGTPQCFDKLAKMREACDL